MKFKVNTIDIERVAGPKATIREASFEDLLAIRKMHAKSWLAVYPNDEAGVSEEWVRGRVSNWITPEGIEKSKEHFKGIFGNPNHFYRIATVDNAVVGLVHVSRDDAKQHLDALYIDESEYGSGLAQELMGMADDWLDTSLPTDLEVASYNKRAIRFYEKCGFTIVPNSEHLFADTMPVVDMIRKADS